MSGGRTIWWPKDTAWHRRERVVALGEECGPVGPLVLDWLSCEAKIQDDGGRVKSGFRSVARGCYSDAVTVCHALSQAVTLGALEDFEEADGLFECRISGWTADNERGGAAMRQRQARERKAAEDGSTEPDSPAEPVTGRHALSRPVTPRHLRGEESRAKKEKQDPAGLTSRDELVRLSQRLFDGRRRNDPKAKGDPLSKAWLDALRKLLDLDERSEEEVEQVIDWSQADSFERGVVQSPEKLRARFGELIVKAQGPAASAAASQPANSTRIDFRRKPSFPAASLILEAPPEHQALAELPVTPELDAEWAQIVNEIEGVLGDGARAAIAPLHLHESADGRLVIGCAPQTVRWMQSRYGRAISEAAERRVLFVGCQCVREEQAA